MANGQVETSYLLVGAGVAAAAAAEAVRARDPAGDVVLVGGEVFSPYNRPPLSKTFLRGEVGRSALAVHAADWYARHRVRLMTGQPVVNLDVGRKRAVLAGGTVVRYRRLLLAFGLAAALPGDDEVPGVTLPGVYTLRTLPDAQGLQTRVRQALENSRRPRATVVGGGLLGAEVAASLTRLGLGVDWCFRGELPLAGHAGPAAGRFVRDLARARGVDVHAASPVSALAGDGRVQRVDLAGGTSLPADLAFLATGAAFDRRLVAATPVAAGRYVTCDASARTNVPGVWAAGDCCGVLDPRSGKHVTGGHWDFARLTGRLAGDNMARDAAGLPPRRWGDADELPGWHSELFGYDLMAWGLLRLVDRWVVRPTPPPHPGVGSVEGGGVAEIGVDADGRAAFVFVAGRPAEHAALRRMVSTRTPVDGLEAALADPAAPPRT